MNLAEESSDKLLQIANDDDPSRDWHKEMLIFWIYEDEDWKKMTESPQIFLLKGQDEIETCSATAFDE